MRTSFYKNHHTQRWIFWTILFLSFLILIPPVFSQPNLDFSFGNNTELGTFDLDSTRYLENVFLKAALDDPIASYTAIVSMKVQESFPLDSLVQIFQKRQIIILDNVRITGPSKALENEKVTALFIRKVEGVIPKEAIPQTLESLVLDYAIDVKGASDLINRNPSLKYLFLKSPSQKQAFKNIKDLRKLEVLLVHGTFSKLPRSVGKSSTLHTLRIVSDNMHFDPSYTRIKSLKTFQVSQPTKKLSANLRDIALMGSVQNLSVRLREKAPKPNLEAPRLVLLPFGPEMKSLRTLRISISGQDLLLKGGQYGLVFTESFARIPNLKEVSIHTRIHSIQSLKNILDNPSIETLRLSGSYVGHQYSELSPQEIRKYVSEQRPDITFDFTY